MEDLPDELTRLADRLQGLEQRVCVLERCVRATGPIDAQDENQAPAIEIAERASEADAASGVSAGILSVVGKAMLGIAGAYLLRAVAESNALPRVAVAAVAIAYALLWLFWASRAKGGDWLTGTIYASTSALILAPMLWELTLRFNVLTAPATASVVAGFVIAAATLAWKRDFAPVLFVGNFTAAAIALSLAIVSHQMIPFVAVLVLMVLISEYGAVRERDSGIRVVVALAADVAVWALIYIYSSAQNARADYPPVSNVALVAPGLALFAIDATSVVFRTVVRHGTMTRFETVQTMAAFLLATCGLIYLGPAASGMWIGIACLLLSAMCYVASLVRFKSDRHNYAVYVTWSAALFLSGSLMSLPAMFCAPWLGAAALAATIAGAWLRRLALELHGLVFVLTAAAISGLLSHIWSILAGSFPGPAGWGAYVISACAVLCYTATTTRYEKSREQQALSTAFAALATSAVTALLVEGLMGLVALRILPGAHHLAFIRTLTVCVAAIGLAFMGARKCRIELTRIGFATLALLAVKLVAEDLRHGHLAFIAGSIFLFAITLIMVPRLGRTGGKIPLRQHAARDHVTQ